MAMPQVLHTAHIAGVGHQDHLPLCSRHAQALSVSHLVFDLVKCLLLLWAPAYMVLLHASVLGRV